MQVFLQLFLYFVIFCRDYLHMSKKYTTFAPAKSILVGAKHFWRGARVVEEARLESV